MAKRNEIPQLTKISKHTLESMFDVEYDKEEDQYYYNLLDTISIDPSSLTRDTYVKHIVANHEDLFSISNKYYDTTELWWLIAKVSQIDSVLGDLTGVELAVPVPVVARQILDIMNKAKN